MVNFGCVDQIERLSERSDYAYTIQCEDGVMRCHTEYGRRDQEGSIAADSLKASSGVILMAQSTILPRASLSSRFVRARAWALKASYS